MPARLHPGVYVEEVPGGARAIESVGTSTAIFVGETERGSIDPTSIKSISDFDREFGGYLCHVGTAISESTPARLALRHAIDAFFQNGGTSAYVLRAVDAAVAASRGSLLVAASPGAWGSRLSAVYAPSSDNYTSGPSDHFRLFVLYRAPGSSDYTIVERWDRLSNNADDENFMPDVLKRSQYVRSNAAPGFAMPGTEVGYNPVADSAVITAASASGHPLTGGTGGEAAFSTSSYPTLLGKLDEVTDASLLVVPTPLYVGNDVAQTIANDALAYAEGRAKQDLFCIADLPRFTNESAGATGFTSLARAATLASSATTFGAVYGPWVEVSDPIGAGRDPTIFLGPSGFVAGLYARIDQRRGVWKAPAGLEATLLGVRQPEYKLLDAHQDDLNPVGANAIRIMPGGGNVVWGARTLKPASEWRYIPVRRTAIFLRMSIYNSIQWAVFEPNDQTLWNSLRLSVSTFMDQLFRQGAFAGATSREAYFVKCDAETTPEEDRAAGIVNVLVGFAPVRPAEFVIVKLSQITNQNA